MGNRKWKKILAFAVALSITVAGIGFSTAEVAAASSIEDDIRNALENGDSYMDLRPVDPYVPVTPTILPEDLIDQLINDGIIFNVNVMAGSQVAYTYTLDGTKMIPGQKVSFDIGLTIEKIENGVIVSLADENGLPEGVSLSMDLKASGLIPMDKAVEWWKEHKDEWTSKETLGKPDSVIKLTDEPGVTKWKLTWEPDDPSDGNDDADINDPSSGTQDGNDKENPDTDKPDHTPATGDSTNYTLEYIVMLAAAAIAAFALAYRRRQKR